MKRTLVNRAIAKKAKRHAIFAAVLRRERHSYRERHMGRYDRVPAVHVMFPIEIMHRAAEPARTTGRLAEKFRHAGVRARAAREGVGMVAVGCYQIIIGPRGGDGAAHD